MQLTENLGKLKSKQVKPGPAVKAMLNQRMVSLKTPETPLQNPFISQF